MAVVFMITIALSVVAIVALLWNCNRKGVYFSGTQQKRYYVIVGYITVSYSRVYHVIEVCGRMTCLGCGFVVNGS